MPYELRPPLSVARAAARGLRLRQKFGRGGTWIGLARGRELANQELLTPETIKRMYSYFARHEVDKRGRDFFNRAKPSNGYIAWQLWGGEPGRAWATRLYRDLFRRS